MSTSAMLFDMSPYKTAIVSGLVKDVTNQTQVQQLKQFESPHFRIRKVISENEQSQTFSSFLRWVVTDNISYLHEICRKFCPYDNCNIDLEFGNGIPTKVMIRKSNATGAVFSCVITFRALMSDSSECKSDGRVCMIPHGDKVLPHLSCCPFGVEIYVCPSKKPLVQFRSSFRPGGSEEQEDFARVILITLDDNDSFCNFSINPDIDEIKEFTKNDKEAVSGNASNKSSSKKSAKRKSSSGSDRANKSAKNTKAAPKRGMSAYMFFSISKGPELKAKGIKPPESGILLGKLWREMSDSVKAEFTEKARKDRERYLKEVEDAKAATVSAASTSEDSAET